jgi:outer membrane protein assembly factor BamD
VAAFRFISSLLAIAAIGALGACAETTPKYESKSALEYSGDAKRAYDKAMEAFEEHDWDKARALFKEVKKRYSYSRYARLAELRGADTEVGAEKLTEAIQAYRSFVHDHRTDPEVPYARFRICKSLFEQISDGGFLLPPLEERDQATSGESYRELSSFVKDTRGSTPQARYMLGRHGGQPRAYVAQYS